LLLLLLILTLILLLLARCLLLLLLLLGCSSTGCWCCCCWFARLPGPSSFIITNLPAVMPVPPDRPIRLNNLPQTLLQLLTCTPAAEPLLQQLPSTTAARASAVTCPVARSCSSCCS
jgi:hypothetical protein